MQISNSKASWEAVWGRYFGQCLEVLSEYDCSSALQRPPLWIHRLSRAEYCPAPRLGESEDVATRCRGLWPSTGLHSPGFGPWDKTASPGLSAAGAHLYWNLLTHSRGLGNLLFSFSQISWNMCVEVGLLPIEWVRSGHLPLDSLHCFSSCSNQFWRSLRLSVPFTLICLHM